MGSKPQKPVLPPTITIGGKTIDTEELLKECEGILEKLTDGQLEESAGFEVYEQTLLKVVHEIARRKLEKKLQDVSHGFADRIVIDHHTDWHVHRHDGGVSIYRKHCPGTVAYHSLVGPLHVRRYTYREQGGAQSLVPLELKVGLMERMTPALARCMAIGYAHMPLRVCEELLLAGGLRPPSRSTLDRSMRDLGAYAVHCNAEIEPAVRANELVPAELQLVAIGLDRVAVPMRHGEEYGTSDVYRRTVRTSRPKPKHHSEIKGPVQWRMDYVGTVALLDGDKNLLECRKYRVPGNAKIEVLVERVMADLRHVLGQRPVDVAVVQDGAPELWTATTAALTAAPWIDTWTDVLDWYHLDERLSKCLDLCTADVARAAQRGRWHTRLLETPTGAKDVILSLKRKMRATRATAPANAELVAEHIGYLERNQHRMEYGSYRRRNIPIGSGITEGACKSVVNVRAKRSGQRWSKRGLAAVLHLRAMHQSNRFDAFWSFFSRRYRATHLGPVLAAPRNAA